MNISVKLKVDPLNYAAGLESPIGVYIRREIFKKKTKSDSILRKRLYERTVADQSMDGSWNQLFVRTANNLWNLALLGCERARSFAYDSRALYKSINKQKNGFFFALRYFLGFRDFRGCDSTSVNFV
jgi:hypothetical protein